MIQQVQFLDPDKVKLPPALCPSYAFRLASIKGKTFQFKPGLNIIIGENGCGKTSLLNVIRHLTFCDELYYSSIRVGRECWGLHTRHSFEDGYWHLAKMKSQYSLSTFNLRKHNDFLSADFSASMANMMQTMRSKRRSEGQNVMEAIRMMLLIHEYGEEALRANSNPNAVQSDKKGLLPHHYFKNTVLDVIKKQIPKCTESWRTMYEELRKYYQDNELASAEERKAYRGFTFLMDEPDKGMDVFNVTELYDFISSCPNYCQMIVVLHNIGLIHKLYQRGGVNFIEMSNGYLDKVEEFYK